MSNITYSRQSIELPVVLSPSANFGPAERSYFICQFKMVKQKRHALKGANKIKNIVDFFHISFIFKYAKIARMKKFFT